MKTLEKNPEKTLQDILGKPKAEARGKTRESPRPSCLGFRPCVPKGPEGGPRAPRALSGAL